MGEVKQDGTMKRGLEVLERFGPTSEDRKAIGQTLFGRVMTQSTAALTLVIAYVGAIALLYRFIGDDLAKFHQASPILFWIVVLAFPALILIFSVAPAYRRARNDQRLVELVDRVEAPDPGYFRLHPYEKEDFNRFKRPDGALDEALAWLRATEETVLYLNGASGSGKSSLIAAGILPTLEIEGWSTTVVRGMGTPFLRLRSQLQVDGETFQNIEEALKSAGEVNLQKSGKPLLIVLDQFEEYLILEGGEDRKDYAVFLQKVAQTPIPGIRLLHVFRSDYSDLLFKQDLPSLRPRENGFQLSGLRRKEAEIFLDGAPRKLPRESYDRLFHGLDTIEKTRGLYQPITLNMVGFVLDREGATLSGEPEELIDTYLKDCLQTGRAVDTATPVLDAMITSVGTKKALTVAEIAHDTSIEEWKAKSTLVEMREAGLVRRVFGDTWEISHDFIARVLARLLGRLHVPWYHRVNTRGLAFTGAGWLVAISLAVPLYISVQEEVALARIQEIGLRQMPLLSGGFGFEVPQYRSTERMLTALRAMELPFDIEALSFSGSTLTSLDLLVGYPLNSLRVFGASNLVDISALEGMPLEELFISEGFELEDISPLAKLPLRKLQIVSPKITDFTLLKGLKLEYFSNVNARYGTELINNPEINFDYFRANTIPSIDFSDFDFSNMPLESLVLSAHNINIDMLSKLSLIHLALSGSTTVDNIAALAEMKLETLHLYNMKVADLSPLRGMPLTTLSLDAATEVTDLSPLSGMPLTRLVLNSASNITDLSPLKGIPLTGLSLDSATDIVDLSPLEGMPLIELSLDSATDINDLSPLFGMPLIALSLNSAAGITDLSPLSGMPLSKLYLGATTDVKDLSPIVNAPLQELGLASITGVIDLSILKKQRLYSLSMPEARVRKIPHSDYLPRHINIGLDSSFSDLGKIAEGKTVALSLSGATKIENLTPLTGMHLNSLILKDAQRINSLEPLRDMFLQTLSLPDANNIVDLSPLEAMPLTSLNLGSATGIIDLSPLKAMPLTFLNLGSATGIIDLSPLKAMPLTSLNLGSATGIIDLSPLEAIPLTSLDLGSATSIIDLSPLKAMPLTSLNLGSATDIVDLSPLYGKDFFHIVLPNIPLEVHDIMNASYSTRIPVE